MTRESKGNFVFIIRARLVIRSNWNWNSSYSTRFTLVRTLNYREWSRFYLACESVMQHPFGAESHHAWLRTLLNCRLWIWLCFRGVAYCWQHCTKLRVAIRFVDKVYVRATIHESVPATFPEESVALHIRWAVEGPEKCCRIRILNSLYVYSRSAIVHELNATVRVHCHCSKWLFAPILARSIFPPNSRSLFLAIISDRRLRGENFFNPTAHHMKNYISFCSSFQIFTDQS